VSRCCAPAVTGDTPGNDGFNEVNYVGGVEVGLTPRLTIVGDVIGRTLHRSFRLSGLAVPHTFQQGETAPIERATLDGVSLTPGSLTTGLGAAGFKYNPAGNLLISAHVLFSLNDAGLRSKITPVIGFDYTF
jgi:hypothetical protein